jgi:hypothetical protein
MKEKKRVNPVKVKRKYDFYTITDDKGKRYTLYDEDHDIMVRLLMETDETDPEQAEKGYIKPSALSTKLCELYPSLKTKMLRPTGKFYDKYYLPLKILDHYRYIDYFKDGTIKKHNKFRKMTPSTNKYGLDKWY